MEEYYEELKEVFQTYIPDLIWEMDLRLGFDMIFGVWTRPLRMLV